MALITAIKDRISQLSSASFQILCDAYLFRVGYSNLVALGTKAGAEKTTPGTPDTYCCKDGKYIFVEYTTQQDQLVRKIESDLAKCFDESNTHVPVDQISEIIYFHTSSNISPGDDQKLKKLCTDRGVALTLIGIDKLADDILWNHKVLAKDHLGLPIDTEQIQTVDDFVRQYDSNLLAAPLDTAFLARDTELNALESAFSRADVVIVTGPAGVGKTRLSLEFSKKHSRDHSEKLYCIHSRAQSLYDDLHLYFDQPDRYFLLIDDANQISDLSIIVGLISHTRTGFSFKVLITVRDYAISKVRNSLQGLVIPEEVPIHPLKDDDIKALMQNQFGIKNEAYLDRIAAIAEGNARIAMMAGRLAAEAGRLDSIGDATALYDEYYGPVLRDTKLAEDAGLLAAAGIAAFLDTLHLDHMDFLLPIFTEAGFDKDDIAENMFRLSDLEIVDIYHDKAVKFSEQCFGNYILKYVFCDKKALSLSRMIEICFFQSQQRTMQAVNTLLSVYRSEELHEFVGSEINVVWSRLKASDDQKFWSFLKLFYPVNPTEVLCLLKAAIDEMPPVILSADEIDTEKGKSYQNVSDDIISVLGGFADSEDLESALDLFFQYYLKSPDKYIQFFHAATSAYCIKPSSFINGFRTQILFFSKLIEYSDGWNNDLILLLFLDVVGEFLNTEFSPSEMARDGKRVLWYQITVSPSEGLSNYRALIWNALEEIANSGKQPERLRKVIKKYSHISANEVIREEASSVCKVINAGMCPEILDDCLIVKRVAGLLERCNASADALRPFLFNPAMEVYRILLGPDYDSGLKFQMRKAEHQKWIQGFFASKESKEDAFILLYDTFCSVKEPDHTAIFGLNHALQYLADDTEAIITVSRYILEKGDRPEPDLFFLVRSLFAALPVADVYSLIINSAADKVSVNRWLFAYYCEIPRESINEEQLLGLYRFLNDHSDAEIRSTGYRDISFLQKYLALDPNVFVKASQIILDKRQYSPFITNIFFTLLMNPYHRDDFDLIQAYRGNIHVLEDIYFFLLHNGSNEDLEGSILLKIAKEDPAFAHRLASELLQKMKAHSLYDADSRYSALYDLDNFLVVIDTVVNDAIEAEDYTPFVSNIVKQFLVLPSKRQDLETRRDQWLQQYIQNYAFDREKMDCLFDALSERTSELRKKCIAWFLEVNPDFDAFQALTLLPRAYGGFGSFVPIYKGWVAFLESLLPLFHGIQFIEHKRYITERITELKKVIVNEEISDIIKG